MVNTWTTQLQIKCPLNGWVAEEPFPKIHRKNIGGSRVLNSYLQLPMKSSIHKSETNYAQIPSQSRKRSNLLEEGDFRLHYSIITWTTSPTGRFSETSITHFIWISAQFHIQCKFDFTGYFLQEFLSVGLCILKNLIHWNSTQPKPKNHKYPKDT